MIYIAIAWIAGTILGWWLWAVDWKRTFGSVTFGEAFAFGAVALACPPVFIVVGLGFLALSKSSRLNAFLSRKVF